jgi:hydrogenase maturation factor
MCLSDLGRVIDHDAATSSALVDVDGRPTPVSTITLGLDAPEIAPDTWLVIHTGFAVSMLTDAEAQEILTARADLAPSTSSGDTS